MIKTVTRWYCSICGYGRPFDPAKQSPPKACPECNDGQGHGSFAESEIFGTEMPHLFVGQADCVYFDRKEAFYYKDGKLVRREAMSKGQTNDPT
jgi:hypothetical protein